MKLDLFVVLLKRRATTTKRHVVSFACVLSFNLLGLQDRRRRQRCCCCFHRCTGGVVTKFVQTAISRRSCVSERQLNYCLLQTTDIVVVLPTYSKAFHTRKFRESHRPRGWLVNERASRRASCAASMVTCNKGNCLVHSRTCCLLAAFCCRFVWSVSQFFNFFFAAYYSCTPLPLLLPIFAKQHLLLRGAPALCA